MVRLAVVCFCCSLALVGGCARSHGPGDGRGFGPGHDAQMTGVRGGVSRLWAEPAALFLVGLESTGTATLSQAEFAAAGGMLWHSADTDGDGIVRSLELQAWRKTWFGTDDGWPGLFHFDQNGDGLIDEREFKAGLESIFAAFDKNKNGVIDRSELLIEQRGSEFGRPSGKGPADAEPGRRGRRSDEGTSGQIGGQSDDSIKVERGPTP